MQSGEPRISREMAVWKTLWLCRWCIVVALHVQVKMCNAPSVQPWGSTRAAEGPAKRGQK